MSESQPDTWALVSGAVAEVLAERGEEPGELGPATSLGADLGISSVDVIHLMITLEDRLGIPLSFQELAVRDGEYADDLTLGEIAAFVSRSLQDATRSSPSS